MESFGKRLFLSKPGRFKERAHKYKLERSMNIRRLIRSVDPIDAEGEKPETPVDVRVRRVLHEHEVEKAKR
jgi:hypothetical protein